MSRARRVLPPAVLLKRMPEARDFLEHYLGLSTGQVEVTTRLLRLFAYYGYVYPKASQVVGEIELTPEIVAWRAENNLPGRESFGRPSRSTFWRTITRLEGLGLIEVINRFVIRDHAQISNLYRLDQLVLVLARYIAERRGLDCPKWLEPVLNIPARKFYAFLSRDPEARSGPALPYFSDLLLDFSA